MRLQAITWAIASGETGNGKTTVAGCLAALLQNQGARAVILNADLARENYLLSASINAEPDALFQKVLSQGYLSLLRQRLGEDFDRTLAGLQPLLRGQRKAQLQLILDFGAGPSAKYAEFFPLVKRPVVVATGSGESVAKALSFIYRALLHCIARRLQEVPEATQLLRQALAREAAGQVIRLSEIAYHLIGINRHTAEVARGFIRSYRPLIVLNRTTGREAERKLRILLAEVRLETDLEIGFGGVLPSESRLTDVAAQVAKLSLDDPESEYAIWLAREFARKLQGVKPPDPPSEPPSSKPAAGRKGFWSGRFGSLSFRAAGAWPGLRQQPAPRMAEIRRKEKPRRHSSPDGRTLAWLPDKIDRHIV